MNECISPVMTIKKKSFLIYELQCLRVLTVVNENGHVATANIYKMGDEGKIKFKLDIR